MDTKYGKDFDEFKKYCNNYDLLETYIKFTYISSYYYKLSNGLIFYAHISEMKIIFDNTIFSITEFIEFILTNYPDVYKYDYGQIKSIIN